MHGGSAAGTPTGATAGLAGAATAVTPTATATTPSSISAAFGASSSAQGQQVLQDFDTGSSSTRITLHPPPAEDDDNMAMTGAGTASGADGSRANSEEQLLDRSMDGSDDHHLHSSSAAGAAYDTSSATLGRHTHAPLSAAEPQQHTASVSSFGSGGISPARSASISSNFEQHSRSPGMQASDSLSTAAVGDGDDDPSEVLSDAASSMYLTARRDPASVLSGHAAHPPTSELSKQRSFSGGSIDGASIVNGSMMSPRSTAGEVAPEDVPPLSSSSKQNRQHNRQESALGGSGSGSHTLRHSSSYSSQQGSLRVSAKGSSSRKGSTSAEASGGAKQGSSQQGGTAAGGASSSSGGASGAQATAGGVSGSAQHLSSSQHASRTAVRIFAPKLPSAPGVTPAPPPAMYWSKAPVHGTVPRRSFRAHTANLCDEVMWLFGGCDSKGCFRDLWCFDTETMCWSKPKASGDLPPPRRAHSATMIDRMLFVFGGGDGPHYFNDLYIFDTVSLRWTKPVVYGQPPSPRRAHTANAYEGHMIIFGGGNGVGALNDVYSMDCTDLSRLEWKKWECKGKIPIGRGYHTCNVVDGKLIVIGGSDGHMSFNDIHVLRLDTKVWYQVKTDEIHNRLGHTATQVGSYLFVVGGHDSHSYTSEILTLNLVNLQWEVRKVCGRKPPGRGYHQAWLRDSRLFVHGGFDGKEIYDDLYYVDLAACAYLPQITSFSVELEEE